MKLKIKMKDGRVDEIERDESKETWIEKKAGKVPLPNWVLPLALDYIEGEDISLSIKITCPSGQQWQAFRSDQKADLLELVEWLGKDVSDFVTKLESSYPKNPKGKQ